MTRATRSEPDSRTCNSRPIQEFLAVTISLRRNCLYYVIRTNEQTMVPDLLLYRNKALVASKV